MKARLATMLVVLAVCGTFILAQTEPKKAAPPPQAPREAQASYEPRTGPGAGQALLSQFAGEWDVAKTFFPAKGDPVHTRGECHQQMVQDGRFLESDFTFYDEHGGKSTGVGISGFDAKTNKFTTFWYDSRQVMFSIRQSDGTFDGKEIVLYATSLDPDRPGRKTVARAHLEDNGRVLLHRHFPIQDDGTEKLMIELRMTRKGPATK